MPSVNSTANSANSASVATIGDPESRSSTPVVSGPRTNPATRNTTAVDRIVRCANADTSTATSRTAANASNSIGATSGHGGLAADQTSRHT
jgi:hypothetical protein